MSDKETTATASDAAASHQKERNTRCRSRSRSGNRMHTSHSGERSIRMDRDPRRSPLRERSRARRRSRSHERDYSPSRRYASHSRDRDSRSSSHSDDRETDDRGARKGPAGASVLDLLKTAIKGAFTMPVAPATVPMVVPGFGTSLFSFVPQQGLPAMGAAAMARIHAMGGGTSVGGGILTPAEKALREVYIGGLPQGVGLTSSQVADFFNLVMTQSGSVTAPGNPVVQARIHGGGTFAFVQFRSMEETDLALALNGIPFMGATLKIGRPRGYQQALGVPPGMTMTTNPFKYMREAGVGMAGMSMAPGGTSALMYAGPVVVSGTIRGCTTTPRPVDKTTDVLLVSNLAHVVTVGALKEILGSFGNIVECVMLPSQLGATSVPDSALVRFENPTVVSAVIAGLHNLHIGGLRIMLCRALESTVRQFLTTSTPAAAGVVAFPSPAVPMAARCPSPSPGTSARTRAEEAPQAPTSILQLLNLLAACDLGSVDETQEVKEDVADECGKYGRVVEVVIPDLTFADKAPVGESAPIPIYVQFKSALEAATCAAALQGYKFDGNPVGIQFVDIAALQAARGARCTTNGSNVSGAPAVNYISGVNVEAGEDASVPGVAGQQCGTVATPSLHSPEAGHSAHDVSAAADLD